MKRKDNYKNNLKCAFASTFFIVLMLPQMAMKGAKSESMEVFMVVVLVVMVICTILTWIKGTKQYIDHRFQEIEKTDFSEKIKEE